jgi:hypothetical protein
MQISSFRPFLVFAAGAILAGCSETASPSAIGAGLDAGSAGAKTLFQSARPFIVHGQTAVHPDHHKSWRAERLRNDAAGHLLFISDSGVGDVYIYELPSYTLMATITGFHLPQGMCSDNSGDVWLASTHDFQIVEFNHAGSIVNRLSDTSGWPVGCAWDSRTGNLAVTNIIDFNTNGAQVPGEVLVYPGATGTPTAYQDPDMYNYYSVAYQTNGNLFFSGYRDYSDTTFGLDEIPLHANAPSQMTVSGGTIYDPAGLQWHQGLLVGDQACGGSYAPETSCVYQLSVSHLAGTIEGSTALKDWNGYAACDVVQALLGGQTLYGGDYEFPPTSGYGCSDPSGYSAVYSWAFPGGGSPIRHNAAPFTTASVPNGTAISI